MKHKNMLPDCKEMLLLAKSEELNSNPIQKIITRNKKRL